MADRLHDFRDKVDDGYDGWRVNVGLPYVLAYSAAHAKFQETKGRQEKADLARAELFVTAASIVTGSVLMAGIGQSTLRALAGRAALSMICRNNLDTAFKILHVASNSRTTVFAVGKLLDAGGAQVRKKVEEAAGKLTNTTENLVVSTPTAQHAMVEQVLTNHKLRAKAIAGMIEHDPDFDAAEKERLFGFLGQAPIANPPKKAIIQQRLAAKIELSFYMAALLETDTEEEMPAQYIGSEYAGIAGGRSKPIQILPSSPNYPKASGGQRHWWGTESGRYVAYGDIGSEIEHRIDELHTAIYHSPFYAGGRTGGRAQQKFEDLRKAEATLGRLANETRPQQLLDVRV